MNSLTMLPPQDWLTIVVVGVALWGWVWIGRNLIDRSPGFESGGEYRKESPSHVQRGIQLALSIVLIGALVGIHRLQEPTNISEALVIGALVSLFSLPGLALDGQRTAKHAVARGAWLPLGIIISSLVVFLLDRRP